MEDRDDIIAAHKYFMAKVFAQVGEFKNMGVVYITRGPDGADLAEPMPMPIIGARSTEELTYAMRQISTDYRGIATLVLAEAWIAMLKPGEDPRLATAEGIADRADSVEVLMLMYEGRDAQEGWLARITRDASGNGTLGDWERAGDHFEGRLTGLIPPAN